MCSLEAGINLHLRKPAGSLGRAKCLLLSFVRDLYPNENKAINYGIKVSRISLGTIKPSRIIYTRGIS